MTVTAARLLLCVSLALSVGVPADAARRPKPPPRWQSLIRQPDRTRLRDWRTSWVDALAMARADGAGAKIDAAGALLDPDIAIAPPDIPDGDYRCRTLKLGSIVPGGPGLVDYPGFTCRIANGRFVKLDGSQRPAGRLWPYDPARLLFLGAVSLGDESGTLAYGRDGERDMIGLLERIGPQRWRLVLPRPHWESLLDVVELTPK